MEYGWSREDAGFPGLHLSEMLFVDDSILWNTSLTQLGRRAEEWASHLAKAGLKINLAKCELYISAYHCGPRSLSMGGHVLVAQESLTVMGLPMRVQATTCELLAGLLGRARDAFWSMKKLMLSKTPLHARIRLMERVVAGTGLCISMMGLKRGAEEGWLTHRKKAYRAAWGALWRSKHRRWSTIWCERHWAYVGHLARGLLHQPCSAASILCAYRSLEWWNQEKQKRESGRVKHTHQYYFARLMNAEKLLDSVAGGPWRVLAQNREQWPSG